ncbi:MAG: peptidoglycan-binding protein [Chromatiales bacterium]|nr:peptidoglycan-binding protein [Chromatiales bacterium]
MVSVRSANRRLRRHWLSGLVVAATLVVTAPAHAAGPDPDLRAAQARLVELGFDAGTADGLMGRRTRSALRAFQADRGLSQTGELDAATRAALAATAAAPAAPAPTTAAPAAPVEPAPATQAVAPALAAPPPDPDPAPAPAAPTPRRDAAPSARMLRYAELGWRPPGTGAEVLARHQAAGASPIRARMHGDLIVPSGEEVYVVARGERVPGLDCEPSTTRLSVEPMMGMDGPVMFSDLGEAGFCQLGFGIVLEEGQELRLLRAEWGSTSVAGGKVRVGREGLVYVER